MHAFVAIPSRACVASGAQRQLVSAQASTSHSSPVPPVRVPLSSSSSSFLVHNAHIARPAAFSAPRRARRTREHRTVKVSAVLDGVGAAIDLRSRLQAMDLARRESGGGGGWEEIGGAWVRMPAGRAWGVVHFTGGAVLGSYPHIAYDAMLSELCDSSGLMVIATPYDLGTDHDAIKEAVTTKLMKAMSSIAARDGYPMTLPIFGVGHSLGSKLQVLLTSVQSPVVRYSGHAIVAFNNATATDSVKLVEKFARELLQKRAEGGGGGADSRVFESILKGMPAIGAIADRAAAVAGLEFVPSPSETLARAKHSWSSPKALLVTYNKDDLDQNAQLAETIAARAGGAGEGAAGPKGQRVEAVRVEGNHLTPCVLRLQASDLPQQFSRVGNISVGDEKAARELGSKIAAWLAKP